MWATFFQTSLGLWSFLSGLFLCAVYDFLRVLRLRRKPKGLELFVSDFAFCLLATLVLLVLFFNFSFGKVRVYAVAFVLTGFLLWRYTVGRFVVSLMEKTIDYLLKAVNKIKLRCKRMSIKISRIIKTKIYCRRTINLSKGGFGIIKERNLK